MSPEDDNFGAEPPEPSCDTINDVGSPLKCASPSGENGIAGPRGSHLPRRASSPTTPFCDEASSAPPSSLPSASCSRPVTAAEWTAAGGKDGSSQPGTPGRPGPGPLFLSAVVHSGTTTTMPANAASPWPTISGSSYDAEPGPAIETSAAGGHAAEEARPSAQPPPSGPTTELLTAAAARLNRQTGQEHRPKQKQHPQLPQPPPPHQQSQQSSPHQQQQQHRRGSELGPFRGATPQRPTASGVAAAAGLTIDVAVSPFETGRLSPAPPTPGSATTAAGGGSSGSSSALSPSSGLGLALLPSGLLLPGSDAIGVRRQLGARRVPSVVLEPTGRRAIPSREGATPMSPSCGSKSPTRLGDGPSTPQLHGPLHSTGATFALAPLPTACAAEPSSCAAAARGDGDGGGDATNARGPSPHHRQRFSPATVSFTTRPGAVSTSTATLQPTTKQRSPTCTSAVSPSAAPPAGAAAAAAAAAPVTPQRSRTSFPPWGSRPTPGSPHHAEGEGSDTGLGLWHHGPVPVRVTTIMPMLSLTRTDAATGGLTHLIHTQHMRHSAAAAAAASGGGLGNGGMHFGGGICGGGGGGAGLAGGGGSCGVDLSGTLRHSPQFQHYLQQQRQHKHEQQHLQQHQHHQQQPPLKPHEQLPSSRPRQLESQPRAHPSSLSRSTSMVLLPSMPRFTPLPQAPQPPAAAPGSPQHHARRRRSSLLSTGPGSGAADSRPSTCPPPPHSRSPSRSPGGSPSWSPPRSPGRQPLSNGAAGKGEQRTPGGVLSASGMAGMDAEGLVPGAPASATRSRRPDLACPQPQQEKHSALLRNAVSSPVPEASTGGGDAGSVAATTGPASAPPSAAPARQDADSGCGDTAAGGDAGRRSMGNCKGCAVQSTHRVGPVDLLLNGPPLI